VSPFGRQRGKFQQLEVRHERSPWEHAKVRSPPPPPPPPPPRKSIPGLRPFVRESGANSAVFFTPPHPKPQKPPSKFIFPAGPHRGTFPTLLCGAAASMPALFIPNLARHPAIGRLAAWENRDLLYGSWSTAEEDFSPILPPACAQGFRSSRQARTRLDAPRFISMACLVQFVASNPLTSRQPPISFKPLQRRPFFPNRRNPPNIPKFDVHRRFSETTVVSAGPLAWDTVVRPKA